MTYRLENVYDEDISILYQIKKNSIRPYVEKIWGWDESYQIMDFENNFEKDNFRKIITYKKCIGFVETHEKADAINISEIHIVPNFQNQGIGSSIVKKIVANSKTKNKKTKLGCFKENKKAVNFYKNLGFLKVDETKTHYVFEV